MKVLRTDGMLVAALGLLLARAPALPAQGTLQLTPGDIESVDFRGVMPTKRERRAIVTFHVSAAALGRATAAGESLPTDLCVGINGKPVDLKLTGQQGLYSATIRAPRRMSFDQPTTFAHQDSGKVIGTGPAADPNFYIEFGPCAKGCKSIIFHTRCLVCVAKIGW